MKAVVKAVAGPGFTVAEVAGSEPGDGEVLLRVDAASVCGSDVHLYDWNPWAAQRVHPPRVMGHEISGTVIGHGPGVDGPAIGTRVAVESHIICGRCPECMRGDFHVCANTLILGVDVDGGFAESVSLPARNCWPIPDSVSAEVAAAMEPFGNAVHACSYGDLSGATVAVFGCGPIGCAAIAVARAEGAVQVIALDRNPYRLDLAERMGATAVLNAGDGDVEAAIRRVAGGDVDCALEMSGAGAAVVAATHVVRPGGWISLLGLGDDPVTMDLASDVIIRGLSLFGIIGRRQFETWEKTTAYIEAGTVDVAALITHHLSIDEIDAAMQLMKSGQCGKVSLAA